jgi:hypothetical protein
VNLVSVSAPAANDILAVGNSAESSSQPISELWNGTAWQASSMALPKVSRIPTIRGVVAFSRTDGWAVGSTGLASNSEHRTLIEHWNGSTWTIVPSPNPSGGIAGNDELDAVDGVSPTDIWVVGDHFSSNVDKITLLFEHFNGTSWAVFRFHIIGGFQFANAITTISPDDAWVAGSNANQTTLAAHWDGTKWSIVPTPSPEDGPNVLNSLTGVTGVSSNNVYASGYEGNISNELLQKPYVLHWNGTAWSLADLPNTGGEGSRLNAITALSGRDIWAVGFSQPEDGSILDYAARFNGTSWSSVPVPDPGQNGAIVDNELGAVASPGKGTVWATGDQTTLGECCSQTLGMVTTQG